MWPQEEKGEVPLGERVICRSEGCLRLCLRLFHVRFVVQVCHLPIELYRLSGFFQLCFFGVLVMFTSIWMQAPDTRHLPLRRLGGAEAL